MGFLARAVAAVFPEKAQLDVGIPFPVADPLAQVMHLAGETEADAIAQIACKRAFDFGAQGVGNDFVGIHEQNPRKARQGADVVFLGNVAFPGVLVDQRRVLLGDLEGLVPAEGIDDDHLVAPRQAGEAGGDFVLFVAGGDASGDFLGLWTHRGFHRAPRPRGKPAKTKTAGVRH